MSEEKAKILKIKDVFDLKLSIPDYQRPYKWTIKHVQQLLDDLLTHFRNQQQVYRIGTVVIHKYNEENKETKKIEEKLDIVDGQQRLITLSLLLYYLNNENFLVPAGCTAYIITGVTPSGNQVLPDQAIVKAFGAGKIIPKQTGFVLQGPANSTVTYQANVTGTEEDVTGNLLVGTAVEKEFSGAGYRYYLFGKGVKGQGFYHQTGRDGNSIKLPAHRAGLKLSTSGPDFAPAKELIFNFDDATTTGINNVQPSVEKKNDVIYDLQGRRVTNPSRGIYIVNGKKVVISK